jgi:formate dehydrogenase iron-sulfur subunit
VATDRMVREIEVAALPQAEGPAKPDGLLAFVLGGLARGEAPEMRTPVGLFTDASLCIGCKACEVACKEWNLLPSNEPTWRGGYDNTGALSATSWRHVKFVEDFGANLPPPPATVGGPLPLAAPPPGQWHLLSDSCKHCVEAPCNLACPTGAMIHTEFSSVIVQPDVCTGCGSCTSACPFGVVAQSAVDGHAHKCVLCYDRLRDDLHPACAKACPTGSIQFGPVETLRAKARERVETLHRRGYGAARLWGADATETYSATHAFFLLLGEPELYGLPSHPVNPWRHVAGDYLRGAVGLLVALAALVAAVGGGLP